MGGIRSAWIALVLSGLLLCQSSTANSQDLTAEEQAYVTALYDVISQWEDRKITFKKSDAAKEFDAKMKEYEARTGLTVENEIAPDFIRKNWDNLPEDVASEVRFSKGAKMSLAGNIVDAIGLLTQRGIGPDADSLRTSLYFAFFVTFGAAQEEAKEAGASEITAVVVRRGGVRFFSLGWPFCCVVE